MKYINEYDLAHNGYTIDEAVDEFRNVVEDEQYNSKRFFIVVVGYGSSSGKHAIRDRILEECEYYKYLGIIDKWCFGDELYLQDKQTRKLVEKNEVQLANPGALYIFK